MTFEIEIAGRTCVVIIEPLAGSGSAGGRFQITRRDLQPPGADAAPEAPFIVDARPTDLGLSLLYADGRSVDLAVTPRPGGECLVQLPHVDLTAVVDGRRLRRGSGGAVAGSGEQRVTAPMPGRVLRVLVEPGQEVEARQGLLVMEAMKMENELTAVRPGRVTEVAVTAGSSVESGRLLLIIE